MNPTKGYVKNNLIWVVVNCLLHRWRYSLLRIAHMFVQPALVWKQFIENLTVEQIWFGWCFILFTWFSHMTTGIWLLCKAAITLVAQISTIFKFILHTWLILLTLVIVMLPLHGVVKYLFYESCRPQVWNFVKKGTPTQVFHVNFVKFLGAIFAKEHVWWLLVTVSGLIEIFRFCTMISWLFHSKPTRNESELILLLTSSLWLSIIVLTQLVIEQLISHVFLLATYHKTLSYCLDYWLDC